MSTMATCRNDSVVQDALSMCLTRIAISEDVTMHRLTSINAAYRGKIQSYERSGHTVSIVEGWQQGLPYQSKIQRSARQ